MSTTLKIGYLRMLKRIGKKSLIARSVFNFPYRISLGDTFSENPFYNDASNVGEVLATAAWVAEKQSPVIFDIGGHCGFIASQLAFILKHNNPSVYSFEPVPPTFSDLVQAVTDLGLENYVHPVQIALSNESGFVTLNYSKFNSMLAQIIRDESDNNKRSGVQTFIAPSQMMDDFIRFQKSPDVIKIDVEGWEANVFKGAQEFLKGGQSKNTGICLEWNPEALGQAGSSVEELYEHISDYRFFYLNDYEGQRIGELEEVKPLAIDHTCNLFAARCTDERIAEWKKSYNDLKSKYNVKIV